MNPTRCLLLHANTSKSQSLIWGCLNSQDLFKRSQPPSSHHSPAETESTEKPDLILSKTEGFAFHTQHILALRANILLGNSRSGFHHLICPSGSCCTGRQPLTTQWCYTTQLSVPVVWNYWQSAHMWYLAHPGTSKTSHCTTMSATLLGGFVSWICVLLIAV